MEKRAFDPQSATREELIEKLMAFGKRMRDGQIEEQARKIRSYREMNQYAKKGQILFTGSSLMEMFPIAEYCASAGIDRTVYNRGIGGTTSDDFIREIDTVLLDLEPSKIFINIGTNDISTNVYGDKWQEHLLANYRVILGKIKERLPGAEVYIMAFYPVNAEIPGAPEWSKAAFATRSNANIDDTNRKLAALAGEFDVNIIDVNDGIKDEQGNLRAEITMEGVHMYAGGYKSVFEALRKYIEV